MGIRARDPPALAGGSRACIPSHRRCRRPCTTAGINRPRRRELRPCQRGCARPDGGRIRRGIAGQAGHARRRARTAREVRGSAAMHVTCVTPKRRSRKQSAVTPAAEELLLRARIQQAKHEFDAAAGTLRRALDAAPNSGEGWLLYADVLRRAGDIPAARTACLELALAGHADLAGYCAVEVMLVLGDNEAAYQLARRQPDVSGNRDAALRRWALEVRAGAAAALGVQRKPCRSLPRPQRLAMRRSRRAWPMPTCCLPSRGTRRCSICSPTMTRASPPRSAGLRRRAHSAWSPRLASRRCSQSRFASATPLDAEALVVPRSRTL